MSDRDALDDLVIALVDVPATDAFGLTLTIDGEDALLSVCAEGPGVFRAVNTHRGALTTSDRQLVAKGDIVGCLQRGVLLLPVVMPEDGWLVACAPDGARVEHGFRIVRYVGARETITP